MKGMRNPEDSEMVTLGDVVTTDNCVSTKFGDTKLFFKHQWIEDDIDYQWISRNSQLFKFLLWLLLFELEKLVNFCRLIGISGGYFI